ncbi:MAG: alpha/beta fold hydrolase [Gammaproteobacteria bacterium]
MRPDALDPYPILPTPRTAAWRRWLCGTLLAAGVSSAGAWERLVDVGGHRLRIECIGQGRPAVVLDHGLGGSASDWRHVRERLARTTQVCSYDRAGYGASEPGPYPRSSGRLASELRTLLSRAGVPGPYVLAGHSFGGYNVRMFAHLFPRDVQGLVLVDTPFEGQIAGFFQNRVIREIDPQGVLQQFWNSGLLSALSQIDLAAFAAMLGYRNQALQTIVAELSAYEESSRDLAATSLDSRLPVIVVSHGRRILPGPLGDELENDWDLHTREFVSRFKNGRVIIAQGSGHHIPLDEPDLVSDAIRSVLPHKAGGFPSLAPQGGLTGPGSGVWLCRSELSNAKLLATPLHVP